MRVRRASLEITDYLAKMLSSLGLRRFPPVDVLLGIAAGPAPTNEKALNYLLSNMGNHYINFDPTVFGAVAFIPATRRDGQTFLARPGEVRHFLRETLGLTIGVHQLG